MFRVQGVTLVNTLCSFPSRTTQNTEYGMLTEYLEYWRPMLSFLILVERPTYAQVWHVAIFIVGIKRRNVYPPHTQARWFQKCIESRQHPPNKGRLRR